MGMMIGGGCGAPPKAPAATGGGASAPAPAPGSTAGAHDHAAAAAPAPGSSVAGATGGGHAASPDLLAALTSLTGVLGQLAAALGASSLGGGPPGKGGPIQSPDQSPMQLTPGQMGGGPMGGGPERIGVNGSLFQQISNEQIRVQLLPGAANVAANLERLAAASDMRIDRLSKALSHDGNTNGQLNGVDVQKLSMETSQNRHLRMLATKVGQYGGRLTEAEGAGIMRIVQQANTAGSFNASALGAAIFQIDARLGGYPAGATQAATRSFDRLAAFEETLSRSSAAIAANANQTGQLDAVALQRVSTDSSDLAEANAALKRTLDQVKANPAGSGALVAKLEAAATAGNAAMFVTALA